MVDFNKNWLPAGSHWGLHIHHVGIGGSGTMVPGGDKMLWHTTEGSFASAHRKFATGLDAPHVLIDPIANYVVQYLPFDNYAKALEHPLGTPETNRAHCYQVEIAAHAVNSPKWSQLIYDSLGTLAVLMEHRTDVPRRSRHKFEIGARRLSPDGFIRAAGHLGHEHAPNNTHWDPGAMSMKKLFLGMRNAERAYL